MTPACVRAVVGEPHARGEGSSPPPAAPDLGPDEDVHVLCRVKRDIGRLEFVSGEEMKLQRGDIVLIRYGEIKGHLASKAVALI
jgi:hypothetical protein